MGGGAWRGVGKMTVSAGEVTRFGGGNPYDSATPGSRVRRVFVSEKINNVRTRRGGCCPTLPHGSSLLPPTEIGNICKATGVVTALPSSDMDGPIVLWGNAKRVRAYQKHRI
jgi:hypothetical protein